MSKTWCRGCGQYVKQGTGAVEPEPEFVSLHVTASRAAYLQSLPPEAAGWAVTCDTCVTESEQGVSASQAVQAIVGRTVSESDAAVALAALVRWDGLTQNFVGGVSAMGNGRGTGQRYGHLTAEQVDTVRTALDDLDARRYPHQCVWGACGLCGRREAMEWHETRLTWPDGSSAPICGVCEPVYVMRGEPTDPDAVRLVAAEIARGWPMGLGSSLPRFRYYAESTDCDGNGFREPWAYSPQLTVWLDEQWTERPALSPADRRAEYEQKHEKAAMRSRVRRLSEHREAESLAW